MRLEVALALIPILSMASPATRKLLKVELAESPLPDVAAKWADRLPEANAVLDFLDWQDAVTLPPLPA